MNNTENTSNINNTKNMEKLHQWHPAFCSAIKLEFKGNKHILTYTSEYNINTKPIRVDLLVVKKTKMLSLITNLVNYSSAIT